MNTLKADLRVGATFAVRAGAGLALAACGASLSQAAPHLEADGLWAHAGSTCYLGVSGYDVAVAVAGPSAGAMCDQEIQGGPWFEHWIGIEALPGERRVCSLRAPMPVQANPGWVMSRQQFAVTVQDTGGQLLGESICQALISGSSPSADLTPGGGASSPGGSSATPTTAPTPSPTPKSQTFISSKLEGAEEEWAGEMTLIASPTSPAFTGSFSCSMTELPPRVYYQSGGTVAVSGSGIGSSTSVTFSPNTTTGQPWLTGLAQGTLTRLGAGYNLSLPAGFGTFRAQFQLGSQATFDSLLSELDSQWNG